MKGVINAGYLVTSAVASFFKIAGGAVFVFSLLGGYALLHFSGVLVNFFNSYSHITADDLPVIFYIPVIAVCGAYLSVLIKRASCLYYSTNLKGTVSTKATIEILLMACMILMGVHEIIDYLPKVTKQRMDALAIAISLTLVGSGLCAALGARKTFHKGFANVKFSNWYPACKFNCLVPIKKYKIIVVCISQSYFLIAAIIMTITLTHH